MHRPTQFASEKSMIEPSKSSERGAETDSYVS